MRLLPRLLATVFLGIFVSCPAFAEKIRFGVLPAIGTMPLRVAVQDGLFEKHGLDVELVPFHGTRERDEAMKNGEIDGCFGDIVSMLMLRDAGVDVRVVTVSTRSKPGQLLFGLVSSPRRSALALQALTGQTVGISSSTIIEYALDRMRVHYHLPDEALKKVDLETIPAQLQMLLDGKVDTALIPEPHVSLAKLEGGQVLATDEELNIPLTVLGLKAFAAGNGATLKSFLDAYNEALDRLEAGPDAYRELMLRACRVPESLSGTFPVYSYPRPSLPTPEEFEDFQYWMIGHKLLKGEMPYSEFVARIR